jgi:hypothetical protein
MDPIITTILMILLGIIGFFAAYYFKRSMNSIDRLNDSVGDLKASISGMNAIVMANDEKFNDRKQTVDNRLNDHSKRLDCHETDIAVLKEKVK